MSPIYVPGKVTLAKEFTVQDYMWSFPQQYGLWSPAEITTALWLDAADTSTVTTVSGAVSQWNDKSGNGRNATASSTARPTYAATSFNSKPGISFNGTSNVLRADAASSIIDGDDKAFSFIAVVNMTTAGALITAGSSSSLNPLHSVGLNSSLLLQAFRRDTAVASANFLGSSSSGANIVLAQTFTGTANTFHKNGTEDATGAQNVGSLGTLDRFSIGALTRTSIDSYITCVIAEIILLTGAISTDTRQKMEGYLAQKWGLTANLPNDHPYKLVGPTP